MAADTYTRWGIVASGEGGGRIASQFFARSDNPGIDDRILVMNTNRADIRNTIARIERHLDIGDEDIWRRHALEFGSLQGAGNFFADGERCAREDLDTIMTRIHQEFQSADALLHVATLGGGTGNGSIPYVIDQFKTSGGGDARRPWMDEATHVSLAAWPFDHEPPQRHFNAICGLSRLLRTGEGAQNADMVMLAANSQLAENGTGEDYEAVNRRLVSAIDLLIGAGRETRGVIDVQDYVKVPSQIGAYHFTPAVATGLNGELFDLEYLFEKAAERPFVPMDVSTARAAFAVVRAPQNLIDSGEITEPAVQGAFDDWKREHGIGDAPGMTTVTPKAENGTDVDVLLLLGGFDLNPLLDRSRADFESHRDNLASARRLGNARLTAEDIATIEGNLTEYVEINEG